MPDNAQTRIAKLQSAATRLYDDFQVVLAEHKEIPWAEGEARIDDAFDAIDEVLALLPVPPEVVSVAPRGLTNVLRLNQ